MKKRAKKPGDFVIREQTLAWCREDCDGAREVYYMHFSDRSLGGLSVNENIKNAERFAAWLVRAAAWCREANR